MPTSPSFATQKRASAAYEALYFAPDAHGDDRRQLIVMLLDGLAASLSSAIKAEKLGHFEDRSKFILRAGRIVSGLEKALDPRFSPEVSEDLSRVYKYFLFRLNRAHCVSALVCANELLQLTRTIRSAFSDS